MVTNAAAIAETIATVAQRGKVFFQLKIFDKSVWRTCYKILHCRILFGVQTIAMCIVIHRKASKMLLNQNEEFQTQFL